MTRYLQYRYTAYCPHIGANNSIVIKYAELPMSGSPALDYKKMEYKCSYAGECENKDEYGRCPVYLNAPDAPK